MKILNAGKILKKFKNFKIDWKNQIKVPLQFNRITKRAKSRAKKLMEPVANLLPLYEQLAVLASDAYCPSFKGPINVKFISNGRAEEGLKALIVYFAGPKLTKMWWPQLNDRQVTFRVEGFPVYYRQARVIKQFSKTIESALPRILENIRTYLKNNSDMTYIFFVGHALGGAYAAIAGIRWCYEKYKINTLNLWPDVNLSEMGEQVVTFGAPRIGNIQFSEMANRLITHHRITHGNDYVPHFPLASKGRKHFGFEIWIEPSKNCDCPDDTYSLWDCNNWVLETTQRTKWLKGFASENMECNAGQSIGNVSNNFFHDGPYFNVKMGDCSSKNLLNF
ncbi:hypothetical protein G9A89_015076 [Geosiphon pyriformis]|nr:hypothetical protein G9A89_015076 [Geosiphon pyriformis]